MPILFCLFSLLFSPSPLVLLPSSPPPQRQGNCYCLHVALLLFSSLPSQPSSSTLSPSLASLSPDRHTYSYIQHD